MESIREVDGDAGEELLLRLCITLLSQSSALVWSSETITPNTMESAGMLQLKPNNAHNRIIGIKLQIKMFKGLSG